MQYGRMRQREAHAIEWVNEASSGRLSGKAKRATSNAIGARRVWSSASVEASLATKDIS